MDTLKKPESKVAKVKQSQASRIIHHSSKLIEMSLKLKHSDTSSGRFEVNASPEMVSAASVDVTPRLSCTRILTWNLSDQTGFDIE